MKKQPQACCPGCRRHCPAEAVRCKYGREYFAKLSDSPAKCSQHKKHTCKWEKHVTEESAAWQLLCTARTVKHALRQGDVSEHQILSLLSAEEQTQLTELLKKLRQPLEQTKIPVANLHTKGI